MRSINPWNFITVASIVLEICSGHRMGDAARPPAHPPATGDHIIRPVFDGRIKRKKMLVTSIFSLSHHVLYLIIICNLYILFILYCNLQMLWIWYSLKIYQSSKVLTWSVHRLWSTEHNRWEMKRTLPDNSIVPRSFNLLTLSQTSPGFYVSVVQVFWKHCGKRRNCS